jgi:hypothetical protein
VLHHEKADTQRDPGESMRESDQRQPTFREEQDKKEDANQNRKPPDRLVDVMGSASSSKRRPV